VHQLQIQLGISFTIVMMAFMATALFLYLERDRVPEAFKTPIRVGCVYVTIAALNYYYMKVTFDAGMAQGYSAFPTQYRYIDWILTTPLMLLKFPLLLGVGEKGLRFMIRLVVLDLVMIVTGYIGELNPDNIAIHWGFFLVGCIAWLAIAVQLFFALVELPDQLPQAVKRGVRMMGFFVIGGWAIYPAGFFAPLLGAPPEVRELVYNIADIVNKVGLCLLVYATAKRSQAEMAALEEEQGTQTAG
jgi:sensory rhodopsin